MLVSTNEMEAVMPWYGWVLVGLFALNTLICTARVGKPREPLTGADACVITISNGLLIWAVVSLGIR